MHGARGIAGRLEPVRHVTGLVQGLALAGLRIVTDWSESTTA
jgi:hypothetical protein